MVPLMNGKLAEVLLMLEKFTEVDGRSQGGTKCRRKLMEGPADARKINEN